MIFFGSSLPQPFGEFFRLVLAAPQETRSLQVILEQIVHCIQVCCIQLDGLLKMFQGQVQARIADVLIVDVIHAIYPGSRPKQGLGWQSIVAPRRGLTKSGRIGILLVSTLQSIHSLRNTMPLRADLSGRRQTLVPELRRKEEWKTH